MLDLESLRICDLIHASSTHLPDLTPHSVAQSTAPVSIPVFCVIGLSGCFRSPHDGGEESNQDYANGRKAGADDAHVDFDIRPVHNVDLIPCWVCGGGEVDEGPQAETRNNSDAKKN